VVSPPPYGVSLEWITDVESTVGSHCPRASKEEYPRHRKKEVRNKVELRRVFIIKQTIFKSMQK
jgi:hypothetical protein